MITQIESAEQKEQLYKPYFDSILTEKVPAEKVDDTYYVVRVGTTTPSRGGEIVETTIGTVMKTAAIDNLPQYFQALDLLRAAGNFTKYKYLRIPFQEEAFEVGDDRKITIPAFFGKNGIGVTGDHTAEIIYFKMHRFQDAMDLTSCVNAGLDGDGGCFIQWINAAGEIMISRAYGFDFDEDYIYFGWVISRDVTTINGNIQFAIRFIRKDSEGNIIYSYSTLTNVLQVQPGLNLDMDDNFAVEDISDMINTRPIYSGIINSAGAAKAVFQTSGNKLKVGDNEVTTAELTGGTETLEADGWHQVNGTVTLVASAVPTDGGALSYQWYESDAMIPDATASSYTATAAGIYTVKVGNTVPRGETSWVSSDAVVISEPGNIIITNANDIATLPEYAFSGAPGSELSTTLSMNIANVNAGDAIKYQWYNGNYNSEEEFVSSPISGATNSTYVVPEGYTGYIFGKAFALRNNVVNSASTLGVSGLNKANNPGCYVHAVSQTPVFAQVPITREGNVLTAHITSPTDYLHYEWRSNTTGTIPNSDSPTYTVPDNVESGTGFTCYVWQTVYSGRTDVTKQVEGRAVKIDPVAYKSTTVNSTQYIYTVEE